MNIYFFTGNTSEFRYGYSRGVPKNMREPKYLSILINRLITAFNK